MSANALQKSSRLTIADLQQRVADVITKCGFEYESVSERCLLLGEEVGELFKAVREAEGSMMNSTSTHRSLNDELADVLITTCVIAHAYNIDLEQAFLHKEEVIYNRVWKEFTLK